jgi:hypothetical protein
MGRKRTDKRINKTSAVAEAVAMAHDLASDLAAALAGSSGSVAVSTVGLRDMARHIRQMHPRERAAFRRGALHVVADLRPKLDRQRRALAALERAIRGQ